MLLINQAFVAPAEPGHTRHYELGRYLLEHDDQLIVIASNLNYQTGALTVDRNALIVPQDIDGIRVLRAWVLPSLHRSFAWRVVAFVTFMLTSVYAALRAGKTDLVMGTSPPIFQAVSAWLVAFLRRKPFLLEVRDLWPIFAIDMGVLKNPILITLSRWLEQFLYDRADYIVVNSPAYVDYLRGRGVSEDKISFIPYGTDIEMFRPGIDGGRLREELGIQDRFVVVYAGALGMANDIDTLLRAAQRLIDEPAICFVLFGDGRERPNLEAKARKMGLVNVIFAGARPKKEMPAILAASNVCLAILKDIPMFRTTYPNKVFDYMAAGRPTILVIDGVIRQVIEGAHGGVFVTPGDDKALAQAVSGLYQDQSKAQTMGVAAREYVCEHFDRRRRTEEFAQLLQKCIE